MKEGVPAFAWSNYAELGRNLYPGRGIVVGRDETGKYLIQVYWVTGRSEKSRNRIFDADYDAGRLFTEAADAAKMMDPSLVIYNAMRERGSFYIVGNGDQTDTVADSPHLPHLNTALQGRIYEPDSPNFTQRITAVCVLQARPCVQMSILRKSVIGETCDRMFYEFVLKPGCGYCIMTYAGDGDPLPPFRAEPLLMPLCGSMIDIANAYWNALNESNRVSLAVKFVKIRSGRSTIHIINKYEKVG